ncbi:MAG: cytochrome c [Thiotrichales bacterium]|nr:cytochrome c [Thiotrichales bacterium]MCY4349873.1 cytochrome c [Thiotrichales bacterium]
MVATRWALITPLVLVIAVSWVPACAAAEQATAEASTSVAGGATAGASSTADAASGALRPLPDDVDLSPAFLEDPAHIKAGRKLWKQCRHCHGKAAYPGKAPKLNPGRYEPVFVYDRITYGFEKMPPWKDVFDATQRAQLVAYILSNRFSP